MDIQSHIQSTFIKQFLCARHFRIQGRMINKKCTQINISKHLETFTQICTLCLSYILKYIQSAQNFYYTTSHKIQKLCNHIVPFTPPFLPLQSYVLPLPHTIVLHYPWEKCSNTPSECVILGWYQIYILCYFLNIHTYTLHFLFGISELSAPLFLCYRAIIK